MQKIRIKEILPDKSGFIIFINSGQRHHFPQKRLAKRFLAETNKFLTARLYELHDIHTELFNKTSEHWAYSDRYPINYRHARELLAFAESSLDHAVCQSSKPDGGYLAFKHLNTAINNLRNAVQVITRIMQRRSETFILYQADNIMTRLWQIEFQLQNYGRVISAPVSSHSSTAPLSVDANPPLFIKHSA